MNAKLILLALSTFAAACSTSGQVAVQPSAPASACTGGFARGDAELERYAGCTVIAGDLVLEGVTTVEPLSALERVDGTLGIRQTHALYSLSGLEHLRRVGELRLEGNRTLISARALNGLVAARSVLVAGNPRLSKSFGLFEQLATDPSAIRLEKNAGLSAEGLGALDRRAVSAL